MPLTKEMTEQLHQKNVSKGTVLEAHRILLAEGYVFVGYHGSNYCALKSIVPHGFDPSHIGTGGGCEKGEGFYISRERSLASDWAASRASDLDEEELNTIPVNTENERALPRVLRIYAKDFRDTMRLSQWGIQCSHGDPNGDLKLHENQTRQNSLEYQVAKNDLEMVLPPHVYHNLAAIPSIELLDQELPQPALWPSLNSPSLLFMHSPSRPTTPLNIAELSDERHLEENVSTRRVSAAKPHRGTRTP